MRSNRAQETGLEPDRSSGETLYDRLGGRGCLERVHKRLYDRIFAHPTLSAFFAGKEQLFQEKQQTDFMADRLGGPRLYRGRLPNGAHQHLFITDEHFELRHAILAESLDQCGVDAELRDRWLAIDRKFKDHLVKKTIGDCEKRFTTDHIIAAPGT